MYILIAYISQIFITTVQFYIIIYFINMFKLTIQIIRRSNLNNIYK